MTRTRVYYLSGLALTALPLLGLACSSSGGSTAASAGSSTQPSGGTAGAAATTGGSPTAGSAGSSTASSSGTGGASGGAGGNASAGSGGAPSGGSGGVSAGGSGGGGSGSGGMSGAGGGSPTNGRACSAIPGAPAGTQPLPSAAQIAYQRTEQTAFIHFSMATFDGSEQGNPSDAASLFNPSNLNETSVAEWTSSLKSAGFGQAMLVTKHSVGFALWPSAGTDYSVKSSPWLSGKGDVVKLFTDAMHKDDLRVALYLGPWDQKYPSSKADYETYFKSQVTELLAYGPAYEIEFDGFNAPTSNVNWKTMFQYIKSLQPNILIWAGPEIVNTGATPDVQWIGNENGQGTRKTSSLDTKNCGGGNTWCAYECNVSSRRPNWFWHPSDSPMSLSDMQKVYFATVGMNCTLNFNVPPSNTGAFDPKDLALLQQYGQWYSGLYKTNLVKSQPATADSTWATAGFEASKAVDDDVCTYWAAATGKTTARLEVTPASAISGKLVSIREAIELGEHVTQYHVEFKQNGAWNSAPTDASGTAMKGTVIGQRQLWQLPAGNIEAVALVIDAAKAPPAIAEFGVY